MNLSHIWLFLHFLPVFTPIIGQKTKASLDANSPSYHLLHPEEVKLHLALICPRVYLCSPQRSPDPHNGSHLSRNPSGCSSYLATPRLLIRGAGPRQAYWLMSNSIFQRFAFTRQYSGRHWGYSIEMTSGTHIGIWRRKLARTAYPIIVLRTLIQWKIKAFQNKSM